MPAARGGNECAHQRMRLAMLVPRLRYKQRAEEEWMRWQLDDSHFAIRIHAADDEAV
jgi:hypothetical protein